MKNEDNYDPAHEADMRALRKEQLEADFGEIDGASAGAWGDYDEPNYDYDEEY